MKKLIFILSFIPLFAFGQFDGRDTLHANYLKATGDISYNFPHAVYNYGDTTGYTPNVTKNAYIKLMPSGNVNYSHDLTLQGDSGIITITGHYGIWFWSNVKGANLDNFRVNLYINKINFGLFNAFAATTNGATSNVGLNGFWYVEFTAGQYFDFRVTNTRNNNDPNFTHIKFFIMKMPE